MMHYPPLASVALQTYSFLVDCGPQALPVIAAKIDSWIATTAYILEASQVEAALAEMVRRGWVREVAPSKFDLVDPHRRDVCGREHREDLWSWFVASDAMPDAERIDDALRAVN